MGPGAVRQPRQRFPEAEFREQGELNEHPYWAAAPAMRPPVPLHRPELTAGGGRPSRILH